MAMPVKRCQDCRYNVDGRCHALPPRWTKDGTPEQWKYPPVIPTAESCTYFKAS